MQFGRPVQGGVLGHASKNSRPPGMAASCLSPLVQRVPNLGGDFIGA
jgi:hypothetical protein